MKLGLAFTLAATVAVSVAVRGQGAMMRPGRYEVTAEIAMSGRATNMPPRKDVVCITAEDLKDWSQNIVKSQEGVTCKLSQYTPRGNHLSFVRECTNGKGSSGTTTYNGDVTFTPPDVYQSVTTIDGSGDASPFRGMKINATAKRVGDCAK